MGRVVWDVKVRGGAYDGWEAETDQDTPGPVLIVWSCSINCGGHGTFQAENPEIVLRTAEAYRRVELDAEQKVAIYEIGDGPTGPEVEEDERELVGAGADYGLPGPFTGGHP